MEGLSAEEMEAILDLASDGTLWNSMEEFKGSTPDAARKKFKAIGDGIWIVVNPIERHIIDLGNFAVTEHNKKAGTNLVFVRVVSGLQLHIRGVNFYAFVIRVQDDQTKRNSDAQFLGASFGFRELEFWMDN